MRRTASALRSTALVGRRPLARPGGLRGRRRRPPAEARPDRERGRDLCGEPELRQSLRLVPRRQRPRPGQRDRQVQLDRDGTPLKELPPIWDGLTAKGVTPPVTAGRDRAPAERAVRGRRSQGLRPAAWRASRTTSGTASTRTRCRSTAARTTCSSPGPIPARCHGPLGRLADWRCGSVAQKYVLADNFFMGGFGGSFFNHQWLICACAPYYADADTSPAKPTIAAVEPDGVTPEARRQLAEVGARGHPEIRQRRQSHAGLLRRQHDAAALPAERQPAGQGRRSGLRRPGASRPRCRRRPSRPSATC